MAKKAAQAKSQKESVKKEHSGINGLKDEIVAEAEKIANNEVSSCYTLVMKVKELQQMRKIIGE